MGSINALEQLRRCSFWRRWDRLLRVPSADRIGDIACMVEPEQIRGYIKHVYARMKRRKALRPSSAGNIFALVVDGHECCASYLRRCRKCLKRRVESKRGERTQYYHRFVMATLICERFTLLLDIEMQRPGEDEVAAAMRLLHRVLRHYPRAFDVVVADGLYAGAPFFSTIRKAGKHVIAVLKNEQRGLVGDVLGLCKYTPPMALNTARAKRQVWDIEHLTTWTQVGIAVRVVRSIETTVVTHHNGTTERQRSHWMWVTTIERRLLPTPTFLEMAHDRWDIENRAFNELTTYWHADHVYKHHIVALQFFWLMTMLAYNFFHAFYYCNLKDQLRRATTKKMVAAMIMAELVLSSQHARHQHDPPP